MFGLCARYWLRLDMALWQGLAGPFRGSGGGGASEGRSVYLSVIELFHAAQQQF